MEQAKVRERPSLRLSRSYAAAPEKVWRAWTDPQALKHWWGPGPESTVSLAQLDVRAGGRYRIVFGGPDGKAHEVGGVYRQVSPYKRLVFTWTWPNSTPERESLVTVELHAEGKGTRMEFLHEHFFDEKVRDDHNRGWTGTFDKLATYLNEEK